MDKSIGILDKDYTLWVKELVKRYRSSQIKAAIKVNNEMLHFYWELGKDIEEKQADNKYGSKFYAVICAMSCPMLKDYPRLPFATLNAFICFTANRLQFFHNLWKNLKRQIFHSLWKDCSLIYSPYLGGITAIS